MAETAALLVDGVLPQQPVRQWVLSLPFALRYLLATRPEVVTQVLGIVYRAISGHLIRKLRRDVKRLQIERDILKKRRPSLPRRAHEIRVH